MQKFTKYNQSLTIRSEKNRLPSLLQLAAQKSAENEQQNGAVCHQYKKRLNQLEGSIRLLQKKYKQNLKDGFQNKIKSFRLQAVMERKVLRATIQETKKQIQQQQLNDKIQRAKSEKQRQSVRVKSIHQRIQQRRKRVRSKAEKDKSEVIQKIKQQEQRILIINKQSHDKIMEELKVSDRKKVYFESIRKAQLSKQLEIQKKNYISRIIENKQVLIKLKQQLGQIQSVCRNKSFLSNSSNTFVTI